VSGPVTHSKEHLDKTSPTTPMSPNFKGSFPVRDSLGISSTSPLMGQQKKNRVSIVEAIPVPPLAKTTQKSQTAVSRASFAPPISPDPRVRNTEDYRLQHSPPSAQVIMHDSNADTIDWVSLPPANRIRGFPRGNKHADQSLISLSMPVLSTSSESQKEESRFTAELYVC